MVSRGSMLWSHGKLRNIKNYCESAAEWFARKPAFNRSVFHWLKARWWYCRTFSASHRWWLSAQKAQTTSTITTLFVWGLFHLHIDRLRASFSQALVPVMEKGVWNNKQTINVSLKQKNWAIAICRGLLRLDKNENSPEIRKTFRD